MKGTILVVDDEDVARRSVTKILQLEGYQVHAAEDGNVALETLSSGSFDAILLDLRMPGIDGVEVMHQAAKIAPETQIILLTAHGSLVSAIEALHYQAFDYLLKPIATADLLKSVSGAVTRRAELQRKQSLLSQVEPSLRQVKEAERAEYSLGAAQIMAIVEGVTYDLPRRALWRDREYIELTPAEGRLLQIFLERRGQVCTHRQLVSLTQGYELSDLEAPGVLRPLVSRLRRKLHAVGGEKWVVSVRGVGYVFDADNGHASAG